MSYPGGQHGAIMERRLAANAARRNSCQNKTGNPSHLTHSMTRSQQKLVCPNTWQDLAVPAYPCTCLILRRLKKENPSHLTPSISVSQQKWVCPNTWRDLDVPARPCTCLTRDSKYTEPATLGRLGNRRTLFSGHSSSLQGGIENQRIGK